MPFKCVVPGCRSNYYHVKGTQSVPMTRYPSDPMMIQAWNTAISRPGFKPTPHSHVCVKHFREDQLCVKQKLKQDQELKNAGYKWIRRSSKLRADAVPCVFEKDPSTHELPPYIRYGHKRKKTHKGPKKGCEILAGLKSIVQVEFKPEMWNETKKAPLVLQLEPPVEPSVAPPVASPVAPPVAPPVEPPVEPPKKRGRGRPRKQVLQPKPEGGANIKSIPGVEPPKKRGRGRPRKQVLQPKPEGDANVISEVVSCCALACTNTSENFTMVNLPEHSVLRKLWVEKIDRLDWSPDSDSALCEIHFDEESWDTDIVSGKGLRHDAIPSLFLHGEGIKSWVTMDNTGNIADIVVDGRSTQDDDSNNGSINGDITEESMDCSEQDEEDPSIFVKREALEPEIDMVEGSEEDMVPREPSAGEQFETIYCDSTFNDHENLQSGSYENNEDENIATVPNSMSEENPLADERSSSPILQDGEVSCLEDSTNNNKDNDSNYLVISKSQALKNEEKIRRRTSNQLTSEFQCPICDRKLSRRKNLEIHMQKLHPFGELSENNLEKNEAMLSKLKEEKLKLKKISEYHKKKKEAFLSKFKEAPKNGFKKSPPPLKPIVPQCLLSPTIPFIPLKTSNSMATSTSEGVLTTSFPIISFSSQSPLVSSSVQTTSSTIVTPTLVASQPLITNPLGTPTALIASSNLVASSSAGTLISSSSIVTTPRPLDPSPAGGEMRKQQFLLLLPQKTVIPSPPPQSVKKPNPPKPLKTTEIPLSPKEELYSVDLSAIKESDKRVKLKEKLRELVDAVVKKNLNPERIIIAYDRT